MYIYAITVEKGNFLNTPYNENRAHGFKSSVEMHTFATLRVGVDVFSKIKEKKIAQYYKLHEYIIHTCFSFSVQFRIFTIFFFYMQYAISSTS